MGATTRVLAFALAGLTVAACAAEQTGAPTPTVAPPTSQIPANDLPPSDGIAVTEEQLTRADPCALVDPLAMPAYGQGQVSTIFRFTDCRFTFSGGADLSVSFDFALPDGVTPSVRSGVTVYGDAGGEYGCVRGVVVAENAVITVSGITCPMADMAVDTMLPELISGELVPAGRPKNSLANLDACALVRPEEAFQVRGIDRTQVTPAFHGQSCTWGNPEVSDPNLFIKFGPPGPLGSYSDEERSLEIGAFDALVYPVPGATTEDYREPPGCEVRIDYQPGDTDPPEEILLTVSADGSDEDNCDLATELAKAAVGRLPSP